MHDPCSLQAEPQTHGLPAPAQPLPQLPLLRDCDHRVPALPLAQPQAQKHWVFVALLFLEIRGSSPGGLDPTVCGQLVPRGPRKQGTHWGKAMPATAVPSPAPSLGTASLGSVSPPLPLQKAVTSATTLLLPFLVVGCGRSGAGSSAILEQLQFGQVTAWPMGLGCSLGPEHAVREGNCVPGPSLAF